MTLQPPKEFVRITVTKDIIASLFETHERPVRCVNGLPHGYRLVGVVQNEYTGLFSFLLTNDKGVEGAAATDFQPTYEAVECLDKAKVKAAIDKRIVAANHTVQKGDHVQLMTPGGDNVPALILKELRSSLGLE